MDGWELDSFVNVIAILYHIALWFGTVSLLAIAVYALCRIVAWVFGRVRRLIGTERDFSAYLWDRANGNAPHHVSMVIVTSDDGWQACYLDGEKFFEAERIAPWDQGMRRAGCIVTHRIVKQAWLDSLKGTYPRMLADVEFDDNPLI